MVMVTRSAYRKASESSDNISCKKIIPPWCSSSKVSEKRKPRKITSTPWQTQSSYHLRENIWEYLYEDKSKQSVNCSCKRTRKARKQRDQHKRCGKTTVILLTFLVITLCMMVSLWMTNSIPRLKQLTKLIGNEKLTSLLRMEDFTSVGEECCNRMKYLAAELSRAEKSLRNTLRIRRTMLATSESAKEDTRRAIDRGYIEGATVTIGKNTVEWDGRVELWGVVPLWRAARPPNTVVALRKPTPADCWPFSGTHGEVIVELPRQRRVRCVSIEHVRPDVANSAPKHFIVYGVLQNDTWVKTADGEYRSSGPAKQYYPIFPKNIVVKQIALSVQSNHGNPKFTCLYRFHVYGYEEDNLKFT